MVALNSGVKKIDDHSSKQDNKDQKGSDKGAANKMRDRHSGTTVPPLTTVQWTIGIREGSCVPWKTLRE